MDAEQRAAARARCDKATPGLWEKQVRGHENIDPDPGDEWDACFYAVGPDHRGKYPPGTAWNEALCHKQAEADSDFIAHARQDLPAALDDLEVVERNRDALLEEVSKVKSELAQFNAELQDCFVLPAIPQDELGKAAAEQAAEAEQWEHEQAELRAKAERCEAAEKEIERLKAGTAGHGEPCYYCGEPCNAVAGDPGRWPVALCHPDAPGVVKWHHAGCISHRLAEVERLRKELAEARTHYGVGPGRRYQIDGEGLCDHPWHRNPGLITDCPECKTAEAAGGKDA